VDSLERAILSEFCVTMNCCFHRTHKIRCFPWRAKKSKAGSRNTVFHRSWGGQSTKKEDDCSKSYNIVRVEVLLAAPTMSDASSLTDAMKYQLPRRHSVMPARYWHYEISVSSMILCDASSFLENMKYQLPLWHDETPKYLLRLSDDNLAEMSQQDVQKQAYSAC
jgi:hypothetical protein